jgi:hypothetical protein
MDSPAVAEQTERPYISTGHLPGAETVQKLVCDAHRRFKSNTDGQNSQVEVYASASDTNFRNRSIAWLSDDTKGRGRQTCGPNAPKSGRTA